MRKMLVSVVVPIYNVSRYIESSIESICKQKFDGDFEIILVDDGSLDNSVELATQVLNRYNFVNWKVVRKENGGLPSARNRGLENSKGKYICFIDSDDIIHETHLIHLYNLCEEKNLNISYCDFELTSEELRSGIDNNFNGIEIIDRKNLLNGFLIRSLKIHCCAILFNHQYLIDNNIKFNEKLRYGEDIEFMWRVFPDNNIIGHVKQKNYKYLQRANSLMTSQSNQRVITLIEEFNKTVDENIEKYPDDYDVFKFLKGKAYLAFIRTSAEASDMKNFMELINTITYKEEVRKVININQLYLRLLSFILYVNPRVFYYIVKANKRISTTFRRKKCK